MGCLSLEQQACSEQVRKFIDDNEIDQHRKLDDYDVLRFCRARKFVIKDVTKMIQKHAKWRKKYNVDDIERTFNFTEENTLK